MFWTWAIECITSHIIFLFHFSYPNKTDVEHAISICYYLEPLIISSRHLESSKKCWQNEALEFVRCHILLFSVLGTKSFIWKFLLSLKQVHGRKYFIIMDNQLLDGRVLNKMFFPGYWFIVKTLVVTKVIKICFQRQGAKILQDLDDRCFCPYTIISVFKILSSVLLKPLIPHLLKFQ